MAALHSGLLHGSHKSLTPWKFPKCIAALATGACIFGLAMSEPSSSGKLRMHKPVSSSASVLASVEDPLGGEWIPVSAWFGTADPHTTSPGPQSDHSSGVGATGWGIWRGDPGAVGVPFSQIPTLEQSGVAAAGWHLDRDSWWVEEHGEIMESPVPLPAGKYKLTWLNNPPAGIDTVTLIVNGDHWSLDSGATLHDVTHIPCRAAVYTPHASAASGTCMPHAVPTNQFPVTPGAMMPAVPGCDKVDYAVTFIQAYWG